MTEDLKAAVELGRVELGEGEELDLAQAVAAHIDAFHLGGPDLEAEDIELAGAVLGEAVIAARWADARAVKKVPLPPIQAVVLPKAEAPIKRRQFTAEAPIRRRNFEPAPGVASDLLAKQGAPEPKIKGDKVAQWTPVPKGVSDLEALTYVPGLTGEIVEWIVRGAKRPNRMMALGVASVVIGTLIGRVVEGPTRSATHLFLIMLAPTGYGKDWPLQCGVKLMEALGRGDLLGPQEFASAPGFIKRLKRNPLMVCFVDELGDELNLVNNQNGNEWVSKIIGLLKKCYNAWGTVITAEKVSEESEKILSPAPSIVGAATPESFFTALQPKDLESGFANRLVILPFEGHQRPSEQDVPSGADKPPKTLITALKKLCRQPSIGERILERSFDGDDALPSREPVPWGEGAAEVYYAFSKKMDSFEAGDRQRYELGMRVCENAARLATNMAVGRGSPTVDREDIEWAVKLSERSFEAAIGGVERYMHEYLEFPKFCDRILDALRANGGEMPRREVLRQFGRKQRWGIELERALTQLKKEERISFEERSPRTGGPTSTVIVLVGE
jgi:Protein of unknown function (DUF3987)